MLTKKENYNSPKSAKTPTLFKKASLIKLIEAWNSCRNNKIEYKKTYSAKKLSELLNERIKSICDDKEYWCWPGVIGRLTKDPKMRQNIKLIEKTELRPEMPAQWYKNPIEWLSNYDIDDVMVQYNNEKKYCYSFLGVFPIDFSEEDKFGRCLYSHICSLDLKKYTSKGIKYLGLITNLDKHDESGSHWTSTFIIIDPKNKSYGAHYYDSNAITMPHYVKKFISNIKKQLVQKYPNVPFAITSNTRRHQMKNTECGMFSMAYQIRWINALLKYKQLKLKSPFEDPNFRLQIVNDNNINDGKMEENRKYLYRPNLKMHLKKKNVIL
jgi:hypothetical protein